jgi:hypothetical protein
MLIDGQVEFSDAQAVTATANSTNVIDMGLANQDAGTGQPLYIVVQVQAAMTDAGSDSTVAVTVVDDDNAALSSAATIQTIGTFAATSAVGTRLVAVLQPNAITQRYVGLAYTVANGNLTTGSFDAFLTTDVDLFQVYANGYTITG